MPTDSQLKLDVYPIQLVALHVRELIGKTHRPVTAEEEVSTDSATVDGYTTPYNPEKRQISIGIAVTIGSESYPESTPGETGGGIPIFIRVHLYGQFEVDPDSFPLERLDEWARLNAPMTLYPFLREQIFGMSARLGVAPLLLPMMQVPTIKVTPPTVGVVCSEPGPSR